MTIEDPYADVVQVLVYSLILPTTVFGLGPTLHPFWPFVLVA